MTLPVNPDLDKRRHPFLLCEMQAVRLGTAIV